MSRLTTLNQKAVNSYPVCSLLSKRRQCGYCRIPSIEACIRLYPTIGMLDLFQRVSSL